jgi:photosystem II stability/assembly factor-like uncharacterized protein
MGGPLIKECKVLLLMKRVCFISALLISSVIWAQDGPGHADLVNALPARELGPTIMGGRISDLAVYNKEPRIFYVGTASGGVWKTVNGGITMEPLFFDQGTAATGAVTVSQNNPDIVWVGTGEQNSRNSSCFGDGVYRSTDGGKTWAHLGLADTKMISKIVLDPRDENVAYVGAVGHLWGPNPERGLYKTTDAGKTWTKQLYIDDSTGIIDLKMNPKNPNEMIAATWVRQRWPWTFNSGGEQSGIYKTTDGGKNWRHVTKGLPTGPIGRIGLSVMASDPKQWVATVEHKDAGGLYRSEDGGDSWVKISAVNPRPFYFSNPRIDPFDKNRIYVPGVNVQLTKDGGKTFTNMPISVHVDYHAFWIDPSDSNHIIVGNDGGLAQSRDMGVRWEHINSMAIAQFYAVAVDMRKPYYVYGGLQDNGSWGGPTQTMMGFVSHSDWYQTSGGDGFHVAVDPNDWRIVYSESQGGALSRVNIVTGERAGIRPRPPQNEKYRFNWSSPFILSPHNSKTVYFGGNKLFKSVDMGTTWKEVSGDLTTNDPEKQKPGGGVSPENTGAETHCTIISISESPRKQGVLWVGTDDGLVHVSQNDGVTWTNVTASIPDLPKNTWCSEVQASNAVEGRAYATFDGHRTDDYKPYVYVTEDFGATWKPLISGLVENDSCYMIEEGRLNPDLLILGTERGLYISLDRGASWNRYHSGTFGTVRVDDAVIHPREMDLVVATHGRAFWIVPINALEQLTAENRVKDVFLVNPTTAYYMGFQDGGWTTGDRTFQSANTVNQARIEYWLKKDTAEKVSVIIRRPDGTDVATIAGGAKAGLNSVSWRLQRRGRAEVSGQFTVVLKIGETEYKSSVTVEDLSKSDPNNDIAH